MIILFNNLPKIKNDYTIEKKYNKVKLFTKDMPNLSGFKLYTDKDDLLGDYSDYKTLYKQETDGYILSNDGSVYKKVEYIAIPEFEPVIKPSKQELINAQLMREIALLKAGV